MLGLRVFGHDALRPLLRIALFFPSSCRRASSTEFSGSSDFRVSPLPAPLVAVDVAYPHYIIIHAVSSHNLLPRDVTMVMGCKYYTLLSISNWTLICHNGLHFTLVHNSLCIQRIKLLLLLFQWKKEFTISKTFVATPLGDLEKKAVLIKNHILIEWVFLFRCGYQSSFIWGGKVKIWLVWWLPGNGLGFGDDLTGIALSILIVQ